MLLLNDILNNYVVICGDVKRNMPLFTYVFTQMECENLVIYGDTAHSFRSQNFANAVIDGDGIQKCRYLRRCATKNAIIYVCYSADRVQKCRYLRRYSTFFSDQKYKNVVIDGNGNQKCSYFRRVETKNPLFTYVIPQIECKNVVIYGDTAHSFRSQNTQMWLLTDMENKNVVICGDVKRNMPLFTYVFAQMRSEERRVGKECRSRWSTY